MDLRLISNTEPCKCIMHSEGLVLKVSEDNYTLGEYKGKKLTLIDVLNNSHMEIAPHIKKFDFVKIFDVSKNGDAVYFTTADQVKENVVEVVLNQYNIDDDSLIELYRFQESINPFFEKYLVKIFILNNDYAIMQVNDRMSKRHHSNLLLSFADNMGYDIKNSVFATAGITYIDNIKDNMCAVHLGVASNGSECEPEQIVILNTNQLISDLLLEKSNATYELVDMGGSDRFFPYIKVIRDTLVYSRVYPQDNYREEIVFYDCQSKTQKVRMSLTDGVISNKENICVLGGIPYLLDYREDRYILIDLNSQKEEYVFEEGVEVKGICEDVIITQQVQERGILKRETKMLMAYKWPDMDNAICREKGTYSGCIPTSDELLIFMN